MKFILIQIKFDIDIKKDELLETIWKHKKKINQSIVTVGAQQHWSSNTIMDRPHVITSDFCTSGSDLGPLSLFFIPPLLGALFNDVCQGFITLLSYAQFQIECRAQLLG
jgi:hypothetical protein